MENDWRDDHLSIKDRISQLFEHGYFSDCTFLIGAEDECQTFTAHKNILASASVIFEKMFFGSLKLNNEKPIKIEEIQPKTFSAMLKYIYTDNVELEELEDAVDLFNAAKKYMLNPLKSSCIDFLLMKLQSTNALEIYEFGTLHMEQNIVESALKILREETIAVLDSPNFLLINISTLITLLEQEELQTTEIELFNAVESLAKSKGAVKKILQIDNQVQTSDPNISDEERTVLLDGFRKAVKKIQFHAMTAEQFSYGPASSDLLLPEEALTILRCLHQRSILKSLYPKDFQLNKRVSKKLPHVYLDITADNLSIGRIVMELRSDIVPKTITKFLDYFKTAENQGFKGSEIFEMRNYFEIEGLDYNTKEPLKKFITAENRILKHSKPGIISIRCLKINGNWMPIVSSFYIAFGNLSFLNRLNIVIGQVVEGMDLLETIKSYGTEQGLPRKKVIIDSCGVLEMNME